MLKHCTKNKWIIFSPRLSLQLFWYDYVDVNFSHVFANNLQFAPEGRHTKIGKEMPAGAVLYRINQVSYTIKTAGVYSYSHISIAIECNLVRYLDC